MHIKYQSRGCSFYLQIVTMNKPFTKFTNLAVDSVVWREEDQKCLVNPAITLNATDETFHRPTHPPEAPSSTK